MDSNWRDANDTASSLHDYDDLAKRSLSFSYRSFEEQTDVADGKRVRCSKLGRKIACRFVAAFRRSLVYVKVALILFVIFVALRTFHEFNMLLLNFDKRIPPSNICSSSASEITVGNEELVALNDRLDRELNVIREERNRLNEKVAQVQSECTSSVASFQLSIQGIQNQHDASKYMEALRDLLVNEYEALRIQRIGRADYALKEMGAKVIDHSPTACFGGHIIGIWRIPLFWEPKKPEIVLSKLSDSVVPGECWPFMGSAGYLLIQLSRTVNVTSVSYEHASMRLLPPDDLRNAPKIFDVWIGQSLDANVRVGTIEYELRDYGVQTLHLWQPTAARYVKFHVMENHGGAFTCLYRIRVHGVSL